MQKTLIIIPSYNESKNIIQLIDVLLSNTSHTDILVVDDSSDNTSELIRNIQTTESRLFLIKRNEKGGRGSAVLDGIRFALSKDYSLVAEMDADFSHNPQEFQSLLAVSGDNILVIGSRYLRESRIIGWPLSRRIFSKFANFYANMVLRANINDYTNGYRIYGRGALEKLDISKIKGVGYIVLSEILYQLFREGVSLVEVPTVFINRKKGTSNFSFKEIIESFISVIRIRMGYIKLNR